MEEDVISISGLFGACVIEEAEKGTHNYGLIRRASARFFRSIKQAHRSLSGSLSSIISRPNVETENPGPSEKPKSLKGRRPQSFAFGEEVNVFSTPSSLGEVFDLFNIYNLK